MFATIPPLALKLFAVHHSTGGCQPARPGILLQLRLLLRLLLLLLR